MIEIYSQIVDTFKMAGIITLEDGSDLYATNMGLAGTFEEIALAITDTDVQLARWLFDVAQRNGGLMDFDLRGLSPERRAVFWTGVDRANDRFSEWDQMATFSPTVGVIRLFYENRSSRGQFDDEQIPPINLDELWFDPQF